MGHGLEPHHDQERGDQDGHESNRRAGRRDTPVRRLVVRQLPALVGKGSQQDRDAGDGGEEDELLEERVDTPVVEADRGDHVGGMALGHRQRVQDTSVSGGGRTETVHAPESHRESHSHARRPHGEHP